METDRFIFSEEVLWGGFPPQVAEDVTRGGSLLFPASRKNTCLPNRSINPMAEIYVSGTGIGNGSGP